MKPVRNDWCICGSENKYTHCCKDKAVPIAPSLTAEFNSLVTLFNTGCYAEQEYQAHVPVVRDLNSGFA